MADIFGKALVDYQSGNYTGDIKTYSSLDEEDSMPLPYLFRDFSAMPGLEQRALELCKGSILDIGCGAGSHSLYLQQKGYGVTALDGSLGACETCKMRGVKNVVHSDILLYKAKKFDTLLLLMNGIGIVGKLKYLDSFFIHAKSLLKPGGQLLLDSSDIIYMFEDDDPDTGNYYGEVEFIMQYKKYVSDSLSWLYLDFETLKQAATSNGLKCELIVNGPHYDYLARIHEP